jgi:hypothetical protein
MLLVVSRRVVEKDETGLRNVSFVAVFLVLKAIIGSVLSNTKIGNRYATNLTELYLDEDK